MIKINLLPKEIQEKGKGVEWVLFGGALIVLFAVVGMTSYALKLRAYKKDLAKKARWSAQLADINAKVAQVKQLDAEKSLLNAKKNTVVKLLQGRLLYPKFMEAFFEVLPKEIWVSDIVLAEDAQKNLRISAGSRALSIDAIADWMQVLESRQDRFAGVTLSAIEAKDEPGHGQIYSFTVAFTYTPPATGT